MKVLEAGGKLVEKKRGITLRMLLTHTGIVLLFTSEGSHPANSFLSAGFGYSIYNKKLNDYYAPIGMDEFSGMKEDYLSQPLVHQPGDRWEYSISIDWAGQLVERVTAMSLNDYFLKHIFEPMAIQNISMFPTAQMKKDLAFQNVRERDGKLSVNVDGHLYRRALVVTKPEDIKATFNAGGGGCFARPAEYCQMIAMLLNDGTHAKTGKQILKPETVKEMFTNQIEEMPDFGRQGIYGPKPLLSNPIPDLYPQPPELAQGWGLTFFLHLHPGPTGRSGSTGWWAGLPNLFWWADREKGLGGMIASQILPFGGEYIRALSGEMATGSHALQMRRCGGCGPKSRQVCIRAFHSRAARRH